MICDIFSITITVFSHSWKTAILVLAIFALRALVGKRVPPAWRFAIWFAVAIPLIFHVSLPSSWSVFNLIPSGNRLLGFAASLDASHAMEPACLAIKATSVPEFFWLFPWLIGFSAVWLAGCCVMTIAFAWQIIACRRWIRQGKPVINEQARAVFEDCCRRMKVRSRLPVMESPGVSGPFLIGALRPILLLPQGMAGHASRNQLRTIFLHELAHLKRRDVWTSWIMSVLLVVHWFNPFLWMAIRRMNTDREEACDAMALATLDRPERIAYGHALLDIAEHFLSPRRTPGLVGISETHEQMTGRIEMIKKAGTWKWHWKIFSGMLFLIIALTMMTDATKNAAAGLSTESIRKPEARLSDRSPVQNANTCQSCDPDRCGDPVFCNP